MKIKNRGKCEVCDRKLTVKDYYKLCRRCQPAYQLGAKERSKLILGQLEACVAELRELNGI